MREKIGSSARRNADKIGSSARRKADAVGSALQKAEALYRTAADALSRFAEKKAALPVLILFSFCALFLTALIGGYNALTMNTRMQFTFYQFYLCDFSAGFCSRVIVGSIVSLFTDTVSIALMERIAGAAVLLSFILLSVLTGAVLRKGLREKAFVPVLAAVLLLFEPVTAQSNFMFLGTLDIYALLLFLLTVGTFGTPLFYAAAPVLSLLGMTVHYHYFFSFFPPVLALYVYELFLSEKKSRRAAAAAGMSVTALSGGSLFVYFVFFAKDHLLCTADEFYDRMVSRFDVSAAVRRGLEKIMDGNAVFRDYFDYYIFGYNKGTFYYDSGANFIDFLRRDRYDRAPLSLYLKYFALVLPVLIAFFLLWCVCASRQEGSKKLPYIAFACIMAALFPELFISSDVPRWMSIALITQFVLLFTVFLHKDPAVRDVMRPKRGKGAFSVRLVCMGLAAVYIAFVLFVGRELPMYS